MLKNFKLNSEQTKNSQIHNVNANNLDIQIAASVVDTLFKYVRLCLDEDISTVKLNAFTKQMFKSALPSTADGTKKFIMGMPQETIKLLLNDLQRELNRRR